MRGLALGSVCLKHSFPSRNFSHIYNNEIVNNEKKVKKKDVPKHKGQHFQIINKNKVCLLMIHPLILETGHCRSHHLFQNSEGNTG